MRPFASILCCSRIEKLDKVTFRKINRYKLHLLRMGWRNFFSSCAVVSFWFWWEIDFDFTFYALIVQ